METYFSKYFGEINIEASEKWFDFETTINGSQAELSITYSDAAKILDVETINNIETYVDNIEINENNIRRAIQENFDAGGESKEYICDQLDDQDAEDIEELIKDSDETLSQPQRILSRLKLLRVVFYPEIDDPMFAVFDYSIGEELTDELLAVKLKKNGKIGFDVES